MNCSPNCTASTNLLVQEGVMTYLSCYLREQLSLKNSLLLWQHSWYNCTYNTATGNYAREVKSER